MAIKRTVETDVYCDVCGEWIVGWKSDEIGVSRAWAEQEKVKVQKETEKLQAEADAQIELTKAEADAKKAKVKAAAEAENTKTKAKAQAEANKELSASITDELIKMKEAEAHYKNGWVTVQGADAVIADK